MYVPSGRECVSSLFIGDHCPSIMKVIPVILVDAIYFNTHRNHLLHFYCNQFVFTVFDEALDPFFAIRVLVSYSCLLVSHLYTEYTDLLPHLPQDETKPISKYQLFDGINT